MNSIQTSGPSSGWGLGRWSIYPICCFIVIALAVLTGWQWDIDWLRRPAPELVAMNPTTAMAFLFSSLSFLCFLVQPAFCFLLLAGAILMVWHKALLLNKREAQRQRAAREVHDELGQQLTGLKERALMMGGILTTTKPK